ncbi:cell-cell cohesion protein MtsF [Archangium lansingense]|uniref:Cell-cell cohesion protein MtsF n=1 Tax=Archangium lansingense TaxID=2995310 RepID=A0ABT4A082_9BACT|nr:cell-cell cohesion protein MtsF [Archangium lansinium]MCY1074996.1 cell-cell cohesion protein MtsF [Archangium lansinium]
MACPPVSVRLLPLVLLLLSACPPKEQERADLCNDRHQALRSPGCQLTLGVPLEDRYLSFENDSDWYSVRIPSDVGPRSVLRVTAVYPVPLTEVNLSVSLLRENGDSLVPRRVDVHGQGQPGPVGFLLPITEPGASLVLRLEDVPSDPSRPGFDTHNPYSLLVEVLDNPDGNEPNDTEATPVPLTGSGDVQAGSVSGYLATDGDVDLFSFDVPAGRIAYVRVTAPSLAPEPPPAWLLSYELLRPDGTTEAGGHVSTHSEAADLATARRVTAAGTWHVRVRGWDGDTSDDLPALGDLRQTYMVDVKVLEEGDPNEGPGGNDELGRAKVVEFTGSPSRTTSFTGRLGSVQDKDWYAVRLSPHTAHSVLHYRLAPLSSGGRFPPLPGLPNRRVRVLTEVSGSTTDCITKAEVCPKGNGHGTDPAVTSLVDGWCSNSTPLCLHSSRDESESFSDLRNLEGVLPVPPHAASVRYSFLIHDEGSHWADDQDYRLEVEWLSDPDETSRSSETEGKTPKVLASDDAGTSFPEPPRGDDYEVRGSISYGLGGLVGNDPAKGQGIRGPADYDAVPSDVDTFAFQLPAGLMEPIDRTWELQWEVADLPDGGMPLGLALDLTFCDAERPESGTGCTRVSTGSTGAPLTLTYRGEPQRAWHSPSDSPGGLQPLYALERAGGVTKVTVQPYACACLEPRFIRGGIVEVSVRAVDRKDYAPADYTLRTAHTDYPKTYSTLDGGTASCPGHVAGGTAMAPACVFTRQP